MKHGYCAAASSADRPSGTAEQRARWYFGVPLPVEPDVSLIPVPGGTDGPREVALRTATPGLSLAWKLDWLLAHAVPPPKDLYDAWLLAGRVGPDAGLPGGGAPHRLDRLADLRFDPDAFEEACPRADGPPARYVRELLERLGADA
ncbi:hypothetical protein ACFHW2_21245 [Actinomadura sp. LOL_016]|uniref:hypothetical protein n=1 Tax=unclassified Actinomadura TaxID=2626254 RepID=UPI003A81074F